MNLMPCQHLNYVDFMFHLDLEDAIVSNCIEGPKVKPTSWVNKIMMELG
jgi:hypothetical protein